MRYRIGVVFLVLTILAACSYSTFSDQLELSEEENVQLSPLLINQTEQVVRTNLEKTTLSAEDPGRTADADAAATQMTLNAPCILVSPGDPYLDQTIPDGTRLFPGESFTKIWRLTNSGSCVWDGDYAVVWFSGADFGVSHRQNLIETVAPGQSIDISVDMRAPLIPGVYQSNWKLIDPNGEMFGIGPTGESPFWAMVEVIEIFTPTSQPTLTSTPTPVVLIDGQHKLFLGDVFNLDTGAARQPGEDFVFDLDLSQQHAFIPLNGARLGLYGMDMPSFTDCMGVSLENETLPIISSTGMYYCYRTNQGLPGRLQIISIDVEQNNVEMGFLTWSIP